MVQFLIPGVAICAACLLCHQGYVIRKRIAAVVFLFRVGKNCDKVSVNSCNGWVRHLRRFHKCRVHEFTLECQLSRGELEVSLLDEDRRTLLRLNPASPSGSIVLDAKHRYNLLWKFDHVTGKCKLHW